MARLSEYILRWSLAYLLIMSGLDIVTSQSVISSNSYLMTGVPASLMNLIAMIMIVGSLLMLVGWQLQRVAYVLAAIVAFTTLMHQSILGLVLVGALIALGLRVNYLLTVTNSKRHSNNIVIK